MHQMVLSILVFLYFIVSSSVFSDEIPIIVVSASKKPQSLSTIGTSITVFYNTLVSTLIYSILIEIVIRVSKANNFLSLFKNFFYKIK